MQTAKLAIALAVVAGCFTEPDNPVLKCDPANPCPSGQDCVDNLCAPVDRDGSAQTDDMKSGGDGGASSSGCAANNGSVVGVDVEACPGAFLVGKAEKLCNNGWHVCTDSTGISASLLKLQPGFFVANVAGYWYNPLRSQPSCGASPGTPALPLLFGGGASRSYVTDAPAKPCKGYTQSADCGQAPMTWQCSAPYDLAHIANSEPNDGVLCCKG